MCSLIGKRRTDFVCAYLYLSKQGFAIVIGLGLMSGSSLDGLDMALVRFTSGGAGLLEHEYLSHRVTEIPDDLKVQLSEAHLYPVDELRRLEVRFSKFCAEAVIDFMGHRPYRPDFVSSHGHTVSHHPEDGYSIQIGRGDIIAAQTGILTVSDFRASDIALGGQGAPLAPIVEAYLFSDYQYFLNLGGIANLSVHGSETISWDVAPFNQVLNIIARREGLAYDDGGGLARSGRLIPSLLARWSGIDYFFRVHPKSLDNQWTHQVFLNDLDQYSDPSKDILFTMCHFVSDQLMRDLDAVSPLSGKLLVSGGGAYNTFFIELLTHRLREKNIQLVVPDQVTIEYKEALLMALMGYLRLHRIPNTIASVTGASKSVSAGAIHLPA